MKYQNTEYTQEQLDFLIEEIQKMYPEYLEENNWVFKFQFQQKELTKIIKEKFLLKPNQTLWLEVVYQKDISTELAFMFIDTNNQVDKTNWTSLFVLNK